jgi:hypothetical protein
VTQVTFHDDGSISRRGALRLGGLTVALAALVAACDNTEAGPLSRVGLAPTTTKLPEASVTDVALLRTCSSLQYSLLDIYTTMKSNPALLDPANDSLINRLMSDAQATAKGFEDLTVAAGGEPWSCGNSKFDSALIDPAISRITTGFPATAEAPAIPPSDDPQRDMMNLAQGTESIVASTYQEYTTLLNGVEYRMPTIKAGVRGARHAALLALTINPGGYTSGSDEQQAEVDPAVIAAQDGSTTTVGQNLGNTTTTAAGTSAPPQTPIPPVYALPSTFGSISTVTVVVGAGDENGVRLKVLLETPSLNSIEYEFLGTC